MFAAGVSGDKLFLRKSTALGAVYGYDVKLDSGFLKFDIDGEWHYPSALPVNQFYICRSHSVGYNPASEVYFCFKEWFGYGHWLMENKPNFWRHGCEKRLDSISWPCSWRWAHLQWIVRVSELEQGVMGLIKVLVN